MKSYTITDDWEWITYFKQSLQKIINKNNMKDIITLISIGLLVIALLLFWPLAVIWSLNTLFSLTIPFTVWTWLSVLILTATINSTRVHSTQK